MSYYNSDLPKNIKWYNLPIFPIVPQLDVKEPDEHNTWRFTFKWLIFTLWSLDSFQFEIAIVADTHWGIGIIGMVPYLRFVATIPCPEPVTIFFQKHIHRGRF